MGNLKISTVKSKAKELKKMEKYTIEDGIYKGETVSFFPTFSQTVIEELLLDLQEIIKEATEKKLEISDEMYFYLINFLAIKHFTHFKKDIPSCLLSEGKTIGILDYLEHFRETGLYKIILDEVFLSTEIQKVTNNLVDISANGIVMADLENKIKEKVTSLKFKHQDAFNQVEQIGNHNVKNVLANPVN